MKKILAMILAVILLSASCIGFAEEEQEEYDFKVSFEVSDYDAWLNSISAINAYLALKQVTEVRIDDLSLVGTSDRNQESCLCIGRISLTGFRDGNSQEKVFQFVGYALGEDVADEDMEAQFLKAHSNAVIQDHRSVHNANDGWSWHLILFYDDSSNVKDEDVQEEYSFKATFDGKPFDNHVQEINTFLAQMPVAELRYDHFAWVTWNGGWDITNIELTGTGHNPNRIFQFAGYKMDEDVSDEDMIALFMEEHPNAVIQIHRPRHFEADNWSFHLFLYYEETQQN